MKIRVVGPLLVSCCLVLVFYGCKGGTNQAPPPPPSTPTGVTAAVAPGQVSLAWNAVPAAASYRIYRSSFPGVDKSGEPLAQVTGTAYIDSSFITTGATYYYVLTALNTYGESAVSAEIAAIVDVPPPPANVSATTGNQTVTLTWAGVATAESYSVYRSLSSGVTGTPVASNLRSNSYPDQPLLNGTAYYYTVTASNASFGEGGHSVEICAIPAETVPGMITVNGILSYEDREYDQFTGLTGAIYRKAVRYADVELISSGSALASGVTGTDGAFSFSLADSNIGKTVSVRVISSASPAAGQSIDVKNTSNQLHAYRSGDIKLAGNTTMSMSLPATGHAAGAFNILDVMTSGFRFVNSLAGAPAPLALSVYWQIGNQYGTYFCDSYDSNYCFRGEGIYVLNDTLNEDTDEYDDDVLYHEFGHFTARHFSRDDSPGGHHSLASNDLDLRLSWSEGFAGFFTGAVKQWLNANEPDLLSAPTSTVPLSEYVDTAGGTAVIAVDFASPDDSVHCNVFMQGTMCFYSSNEAAVAKILWGLNQDYSMQSIWDVIDSFDSAPPSYPVSLEAFWDRWKSLRTSNFPSEQANLEARYSERKVYYKEDLYEDDDSTAREVNLPFEEVHYLYKSNGTADRDLVSFSTSTAGRQFAIKTKNLANGADTYLKILAGDDTTVLSSNDNWNDATYSSICGDPASPWCPSNGDGYSEAPLSSEKVFTAPSAGTYYVEVSTSPYLPPSAGRYGTYTLTITESP